MKLHINYLKKLPGETEYSSEQFYCGLEVVLPENDKRDLQDVIASLYDEAKAAVVAQVEGGAERVAIQREAEPEPIPVTRPNGNGGNRWAKPNGHGHNGNGDGAAIASNKQVGFIIVLGKQHGMSFKQVQDFAAKVAGKPDLYKLSRREASAVIEQLQTA